ncbi:MAG TPA: 4-alpha-glucanotransferase [Bacteroidetes bacterium]|nr:4-alpha-glucanotransferase [Bacteroidota bacterium]
MKITFKINYNTAWGQQIAVTGTAPELGNGNLKNAPRLRHRGLGNWEGEIEIKKPEKNIQYSYVLLNDSSDILDEEWGEGRDLQLPKNNNSTIFLKDTWRAKIHVENPLYTSAFQDVILKPQKYKSKMAPAAKGKTILKFQMRAPAIKPSHRLCILGNIPELGNWDLEKPILLGNEKHPLWTVSIALNLTRAIEYKYGIYDPKNKKILTLEKGANRKWDDDLLLDKNNKIVITDEYFNHPGGHWKGTGVAIPVFSLRSKNSFGAGDFSDIKLLVDWAEKTGMQMVQVLPINDTSATNTWLDSYPYASISVFALHPLYLDLTKIDGFNKIINPKKYKKEQKELNALATVDYEKTMQLKLGYARKIYKSEKNNFLKNKNFISFLKENGHWLKPYSLFCFFRDKYKTVEFDNWRKDKKYSVAKLKKETSPKSSNFNEIAFYYFLQFYLDKQLKEATEYARSKGIVLKGDIPIGIYRYSVDAWTAPHLYNMDGQSGAPPDPFSDIGQNWGFPTYNWEEMAKDGFQWWQNRLKQLSRYFDVFRIDHILGFFRIWEIPLEQVEGTFGVFNKALPIYKNEFQEHGIWFDYDRYCKPFITAQILNETFGEEALYVAKLFLQKENNGRYLFLKKYNTQRKIKSYFNNNKKKEYLKDRLFKLQSNLLFFEVAGSNAQQFHPRIDFQKTSSFKNLDWDTQQKLEALYDDYFYHRQNDFWKQEAMKKLPAIKNATNMLICGEDLGMVPDCVPGVMRELGILSLEIQRMSKNPKTEFLHPNDMPYLSVCTPGTHDMSPLRLWWEEMELAQRQRFYWQELGMQGPPPETCEPYIVEAIFNQHIYWPSMWVVFSIQDIFALDLNLRRKNAEEERINVPANPHHYWRYRMHLDMEELLAEDGFNDRLKNRFIESGRGR